MGSDLSNVPGPGKTIATVIVLTVLLGALAGAASAYVRLPPAVIWAVIFPSIYLWMVGRGRRSKTSDHAAGTETLLLEVADTRRRLIQTIVPMGGTLLGAAGVAMWVRGDGGPSVVAVSSTVIGIALIVVSLRSVIAWDVSYKGHAIRFQNDPCFAERLYIDGQLVARGGVGLSMVLSGTIPHGEGAGETIRATSRAGLCHVLLPHRRRISGGRAVVISARRASSRQRSSHDRHAYPCRQRSARSSRTDRSLAGSRTSRR